MPATPHDLAGHRCINQRLPTHGGPHAREFERGDQKLGVRVEGPVSFNHAAQMPWAANDGLGLTHLPLDVLQAGRDAGRLVPVPERWWPVFPGYRLPPRAIGRSRRRWRWRS
ncbi:LysR substrate-binding domain-containing protein [Burkholderia plantarii]|uniref:LysR substrate-binding domain-containing protein n=1 Tax=Burkholderia plantarii TaxID=41899 RepID=UPI00272B0774|nr:LysR substrate-binding domain-containing protein [Burkholderia plantarii]